MKERCETKQQPGWKRQISVREKKGKKRQPRGGGTVTQKAKTYVAPFKLRLAKKERCSGKHWTSALPLHNRFTYSLLPSLWSFILRGGLNRMRDDLCIWHCIKAHHITVKVYIWLLRQMVFTHLLQSQWQYLTCLDGTEIFAIPCNWLK